MISEADALDADDNRKAADSSRRWRPTSWKSTLKIIGPSLVRGISATLLRPEERGPPSSHLHRLVRVRRLRADGACIRAAGRERIGRPTCGERQHRPRKLPGARSRHPCAGLGCRQRSAAKPDREAGPFPVRLERGLEDETPAGLEDVPKPLRAL